MRLLLVKIPDCLEYYCICRTHTNSSMWHYLSSVSMSCALIARILCNTSSKSLSPRNISWTMASILSQRLSAHVDYFQATIARVRGMHKIILRFWSIVSLKFYLRQLQMPIINWQLPTFSFRSITNVHNITSATSLRITFDRGATSIASYTQISLRCGSFFFRFWSQKIINTTIYVSLHCMMTWDPYLFCTCQFHLLHLIRIYCNDDFAVHNFLES